MAPPPGSDQAALGWYSQKRTFKRKYLCVRPKYTAAKLEGIKKHIYRIKMEQLEEERERERKEREEAASKEVDEEKRKVMEEEAAKAARLAELKAKAETLRQEKSHLFGLLKEALVADARKKAQEEKAEREAKEAADRKAQQDRAAQEAAQAMSSGAPGGVGGYHSSGFAPPTPDGYIPGVGRRGPPIVGYRGGPPAIPGAARPGFFGGSHASPTSPAPPPPPGGRGFAPGGMGTLAFRGIAGIPPGAQMQGRFGHHGHGYLGGVKPVGGGGQQQQQPGGGAGGQPGDRPQDGGRGRGFYQGGGGQFQRQGGFYRQ